MIFAKNIMFLLNFIDIKGIIFLLVLCLSPSAMAQNEDAKVYVPTSAWLVGPASLDQSSVTGSPSGKMPCVVANQFSNGFVVRLSGGGEVLMAMAIDFRQKVFTPPQKYDVEFSVPGQFFQVLSGAAYDEGTLLFSLYKFPDFYKTLQKADTLTLKASGTSVTLNLVGLNDGFRRMNECYNPDKMLEDQPPAKQTSTKKSSRQNPLLAGESGTLTPMPGDSEPRQKTAEARPDPEMSVNAVLRNGGDVSPAGGSASALIAKAQEAQKAGKDLADRSPVKDQPEGSPMTGTWSQPGPMKALPPHPNGPDVMISNGAPKQSLDGTQQMRWRAVRGADLHDVLDSWAGGSGVKLMWLAGQNFAVQRSLSLTGTFQTATQALLEQYAAQPNGPVGRIYHEPGSTQLVLVIEQHTGKSE